MAEENIVEAWLPRGIKRKQYSRGNCKEIGKIIYSIYWERVLHEIIVTVGVKCFVDYIKIRKFRVKDH